MRHATLIRAATALASALTLAALAGCSTAAPPADTSPDAFSFVNVSGAEPNDVVISQPVTISGIDAGTAITTSAGTLIINDADAGAGGTVKNGDQVFVKLTAPSSFGAAATATVTAGDASGTFEVATRAARLTPAAFTLEPVSGVEPGAVVTSAAVTVTGIEAGSAPVSVTNGALVVNGADSAATTVQNGQSVAVKVTAAAAFDTGVTATLTVGDSSVNFTVTTRAASTTPGAISFNDVTNAARGSTVTSNAATIAGLEAPAAISVTGGTLVINGADAASPNTVQNGDTVAVKLTASSAYSTPVTATVNVGGVEASFTATTVAAMNLSYPSASYAVSKLNDTNQNIAVPTLTGGDPAAITTYAWKVTSNADGSGTNLTATFALGFRLSNGVIRSRNYRNELGGVPDGVYYVTVTATRGAESAAATLAFTVAN